MKKTAGFTLVWTETFARTTRKFLGKHPGLVPEFRLVLGLLESDPRAPRLRLHALAGQHKGKYAVSLTYACRIILVLHITEHEVVLLDVGNHDDVYG